MVRGRNTRCCRRECCPEGKFIAERGRKDGQLKDLVRNMIGLTTSIIQLVLAARALLMHLH